MISSLLALATIALLSIPGAIIFMPLTLITRQAGPLFVVGECIARLALWIAGIRIEVSGRENFPKGKACIVMCNHISNLDPPVLMPLIPGRSSAFLKSSLMKLPILGYAFKLGNFIPVARDGKVESARASITAASKVLDSGLHIMTFVEGTRSRDGRLLPFKKGPFYLAEASGAPCIPVSIHGTEALMAKGSMRIKPGKVYLKFHPAIDPKSYATRDELQAAVREAIASGLPEWMRG